MSRIQVRKPITHTPSIPQYSLNGLELAVKLRDLNLSIPFKMLDWTYYYTDLESWGKILYDLTFKSSLYVEDKFDCDNYALKAMTLCAERYGLNAFGMVIGDTPLGRHGFNILYFGDDFMLFEPNEGFEFSGSAFPINDYGYQPELVLI